MKRIGHGFPARRVNGDADWADDADVRGFSRFRVEFLMYKWTYLLLVNFTTEKSVKIRVIRVPINSTSGKIRVQSFSSVFPFIQKPLQSPFPFIQKPLQSPFHLSICIPP